METTAQQHALTQLHTALSHISDGHIYSGITCINQSEFSAVFACNRAGSPAILKLFHRSTKAKIVKRLQRELANVSAHMRAPAFGVNTCIAIYPDQGLAVLGFVPGKTLSEHLATAPSAKRHSLIAASGAWLQSYIGGRTHVAPFPTGKWKDQIESTVLPRMQADKHFLCEHLLHTLAAQLPELEGAATVFAASHGDFVPKNLILNGDAIYGVDIHCKTVIPVVHDLARFLVWLQTEHPQPEQPLTQGVFTDDLQALTGVFHDVMQQNKHIFRFFVGYQIFLRMVYMRANPAIYARASLMMADYITNDQEE